MRGISVAVVGWSVAWMIGDGAGIDESRATEPGRPAQATLSPPVVELPRSAARDPFQKDGVIPTPFVPYAARGSDLDPVTRPVEPRPTTAASPPQAIDAGSLVPVIISTTDPTISAEANNSVKPRPRRSAKTGAATIEPKIETQKTSDADLDANPAPPKKSTASPMTSIRPASISREATPVPTDEATKPATRSEQAQPAKPQAPANFSFPQPVIPLESLLQRLLDAAELRL